MPVGQSLVPVTLLPIMVTVAEVGKSGDHGFQTGVMRNTILFTV